MRVKKRRGKIPPSRYPLGAEVAYLQILYALVAETKRVSLEELRIAGPDLIRQANETKVDSVDSDRFDISPTGWAATLFRLILRISDRIGGQLAEGLGRISGIGEQVNRMNNLTFKRQVRAAYGVDILRNEPNLAPMLSAWEQENLALIKTVPERIVESFRTEMTNALIQGTSLKELTGIVQERSGVGRSRAELIARDQVGRLNGQLAEMRQRSIGLEEYIWRTSQDERVRPTHVVRNGKTYRWKAGGIRPGSEIRCRCNAEPVFPETIGEDFGDE